MAFRRDLVAALYLAAGITPPLTVPRGVEVTRREHADRSVVFVLNHNDEPCEVDVGSTPYRDALHDRPRSGTIVLPPKEVLILVETGAGSSDRRA